MEKISKEELMKRTGISEEDLEKVAGGNDSRCLYEAEIELTACMNSCPDEAKDSESCKSSCTEVYNEKIMYCADGL